MKFYYNGQLIRTSKTKDYDFALLRGGCCIMCSKTEKALQTEARHQVEWYKVKPEALEIVKITDKRA